MLSGNFHVYQLLYKFYIAQLFHLPPGNASLAWSHKCNNLRLGSLVVYWLVSFAEWQENLFHYFSCYWCSSWSFVYIFEAWIWVMSNPMHTLEIIFNLGHVSTFMHAWLFRYTNIIYWHILLFVWSSCVSTSIPDFICLFWICSFVCKDLWHIFWYFLTFSGRWIQHLPGSWIYSSFSLLVTYGLLLFSKVSPFSSLRIELLVYSTLHYSLDFDFHGLLCMKYLVVLMSWLELWWVPQPPSPVHQKNQTYWLWSSSTGNIFCEASASGYWDWWFWWVGSGDIFWLGYISSRWSAGCEIHTRRTRVASWPGYMSWTMHIVFTWHICSTMHKTLTLHASMSQQIRWTGHVTLNTILTSRIRLTGLMTRNWRNSGIGQISWSKNISIIWHIGCIGNTWYNGFLCWVWWINWTVHISWSWPLSFTLSWHKIWT